MAPTLPQFERAATGSRPISRSPTYDRAREHRNGGSAPYRAGTAGGDDVEARLDLILDERRRLLPGVRAEVDALADRRRAARRRSPPPSRRCAPTPPRPPSCATRSRCRSPRLARVSRRRSGCCGCWRPGSRATRSTSASAGRRASESRTLLQSVSGLGDDQIPTGQALPVTAVRSRIFHSPDLRRATLRLHTFDTFVADVVAPYHAELDIAGLPAHARRVPRLVLPEPRRAPSRPDRAPTGPSWVTMLNRLRAMQASFPTYEPTSPAASGSWRWRSCGRWVAYPTHAEEQAGGTVVAPLPRRARRAHRLPVPARPGAAARHRRPARASASSPRGPTSTTSAACRTRSTSCSWSSARSRAWPTGATPTRGRWT